MPLAAQAQPAAKLPRIGVLWQTAPPPPVHPQMTNLLQGLKELGWEDGKSVVIEYRYGGSQADRLAAFAAELVRLKVDVITTSGDLSTHAARQVSPMFGGNRPAFASLAARHRIPTMYFSQVWVESGGLLAYGPSVEEQWRLLASSIDKILKGARPADLPVQQPTRFELSINLKTARALGLTIPPSLLQRANRVIE